MSSIRSFRPVLEHLDDRSLPSISLVGGVLTVGGTIAADGVTVWKPAADGIQVDISSTGESQRFTIASVTKIEIRGGPSNDLIILGDGFTLPTEIFGGRGRDTIRGGSGPDTIHGGRGFDYIQGRAGNDTLYGDDGNDMIRGGDGDDHLDGGNGMDALRGDLGSDTFLNGFDFDNELVASFSGGLGGAEVDFVTNKPANRTFVIDLKGLAADTTVKVFVDGIGVGKITTDSSGNGQLTHTYNLDSNADGIPDFPAGCPELHVGSVVQVQLASGTVVREALLGLKLA